MLAKPSTAVGFRHLWFARPVMPTTVRHMVRWGFAFGGTTLCPAEMLFFDAKDGPLYFDGSGQDSL